MEQETRSVEVGEELARIADELLEHTRALRRQHEELRDALAGVAPVPVSEPIGAYEPGAENGDREAATLDSVHAMALQMALSGETPEAVKEQFRTLAIEGGDEVVDEVFDRIEARRSEGKRRRFSRRSQ